MNTHGHESVAKAAGLPLLQDAFGKDKRSLMALCLGNWMTDVSQAVDPVAYWSGSREIKCGADSVVDDLKKSIEGFLGELIATIFAKQGPAGHQVLRSLKSMIEPCARDAKDWLHKKIDFLTAPQSEERDANLARFFRDSFLVNGYFKFVHPETSDGQPRMDFECFMRVFGRPTDTRGASVTGPANDRPGAYTQYYPHEHLDRPEILRLGQVHSPQDPPVYAPGRQTLGHPFRLAYGKQPGTRSRRKNERLDPDLYSYLRDDIEMTAGLLAEVDLDFRKTIASGFQDEDPKWHLTLAKLGHALHQVEDFFAHSNWAELAAVRLGPEVLSRVIPPNTGVEMIDRAYTTFRKRLKRHLTEALPEGQEYPDERWTVTGYFDIKDTLISLAHLSEELWGLDVPDPYVEGYQLGQRAKEAAAHPAMVAYQVQKITRDALDFLTSPKRALEDRENEVAQSLKDRFEADFDKLRRPGVSLAVAEQVALETTHLRRVPKEVLDAFLNLMVEGSRAYTFGKDALTLYGTVRDILNFISDPLGWLAWWLPKELRELLIDAVKFYARDRFYDWIGAGRIGCHSLIAKDHGREPFYREQKECAMAVHWYIVNTLLRWKDKKDAGPIDWVELLEYFLRNPLPPKNGSFNEIRVPVTVTLVHTVKCKEQLKADNPCYSLEDIYRPHAVDPSQFSWRTIADANFATAGMPLQQVQTTIGCILSDNAWGMESAPPALKLATEPGAQQPALLPRYALKPGLRILIPRQVRMANFLIPTSDEKTWFKEVFAKGWKVFPGMEDPETNTSQGPLEHHKPISISADELQKIILQGRGLRRDARRSYSPPSR